MRLASDDRYRPGITGTTRNGSDGTRTRDLRRDATDSFPVRRCLERIGRVWLGECTSGEPAVSAHSRRIACLAIELDADGELQTASSKAPAADGTANSLHAQTREYSSTAR